MNQNVGLFSKTKSKGFPVYVEDIAIVNNIIAKNLAKDKAKYRAIIKAKKP